MSFGGNVGFGADAAKRTQPGGPGHWAPGPRPAASAGGGTSTGSVSAAVRKYLQQAETDYAQAQAALKSGDLASYQKYIAKMKTALDQAQQGRPDAARSTWSRTTASPSPSRCADD